MKYRSSQPNGNTSRRRFVRELTAALRRSGVSPVTYDSASFTLTMEEGCRANLTNAYTDYCNSPSYGRADLLKRYATVFAMRKPAFPASWAAAREHLLARVCMASREDEDSWTVDGGRPRNPGVYLPLGNYLRFEMVYDKPQAMVGVRSHELVTWGVEPEEAWDIVRDNLRRISRETLVKLPSGLICSPWKDNYDAARVLIYGDLHGLPDDPVLMVPDRDRLLVASGSDEKALADMAAQGAPNHDPRWMGAIPLRAKASTYESYQPPPGSASATSFHDLRMQTMEMYYRLQTQTLIAGPLPSGCEGYVSSLMLRRDIHSGRLISAVAWTAGISILLTEADEIGFTIRLADSESTMMFLGTAPWEAVRQEMGDAMVRLPWHPPRWRVTAFPDDAQLRMIAPTQPDGATCPRPVELSEAEVAMLRRAAEQRARNAAKPRGDRHTGDTEIRINAKEDGQTPDKPALPFQAPANEPAPESHSNDPDNQHGPRQ